MPEGDSAPAGQVTEQRHRGRPREAQAADPAGPGLQDAGDGLRDDQGLRGDARAPQGSGLGLEPDARHPRRGPHRRARLRPGRLRSGRSGPVSQRAARVRSGLTSQPTRRSPPSRKPGRRLQQSRLTVSRIRRGQRGTGLDAWYRLQEAHHLISSQYPGQVARRLRIRYPLRQVRLLERHAVEEPKGADRLIQLRPRYAASDQMNLEGAHLLQAKPLRRAAEEAAELGHRMSAGSRGRWRQVADRPVLDHAPTQGLMSVIGGVRSRVGGAPKPWQAGQLARPDRAATTA